MVIMGTMLIDYISYHRTIFNLHNRNCHCYSGLWIASLFATRRNISHYVSKVKSKVASVSTVTVSAKPSSPLEVLTSWPKAMEPPSRFHFRPVVVT